MGIVPGRSTRSLDVMNPRRVHDLMRQNFPPFDTLKMEWVNVDERGGPNIGLLQSILDRHISAPEVLVEVHRKLGNLLPTKEVVEFIASNIGKSRIRIADRAFTSFVVVTSNGVAAGWKASER